MCIARPALSRQRVYEDARESVRAFLAAPRKEDIVVTRNATEAINLVAYTFGRERTEAVDEIVLSIVEHHSNKG